MPVLTSGQQERKSKQRKIRNSEYYDMEGTFDRLYAESKKDKTFNHLMEIIESEENIKLAYRTIKKNTGSDTSGVDKRTIADLAKLSEEEYVRLIRKQFSNYHPRPVRRVEIPKPNGKTRPLGIPTIVDRIVQQCILQVMEPICEAKFHDHSYGFRPNRNQQHAIAQVHKDMQRSNLHYVVDIDIKGFFDNVNHGKLLKQLWTMGIRDKKLLSIISAMLKAEVAGIGFPEVGTPQGGIISPLLSNVVLNELDWWLASQWEEIPTEFPYKESVNYNGSVSKSHKFAALRRTRLKEVTCVRYADDFKIFTNSYQNAVKLFHATKSWLHERLALEISPEKSKVINLKEQYSEFLGFKLKVIPRGKRSDGRTKYVVESHIREKSIAKIKPNLKRLIYDIEFPSQGKRTEYQAICRYNVYVMGIHDYYQLATKVCDDLTPFALSVHKSLRARLKERVKTAKQVRKRKLPCEVPKVIRERYGKSKQLRYVAGHAVVPVGYIRHKPPKSMNRKINSYTPEGRAEIHKNLDRIDMTVLHYLMRNPVLYRTIEYNDNRLSLYSAQMGKCAVSGKVLSIGDIHCHHKVPRYLGGKDNYQNLVLVCEDVHHLIHATNPDIIRKYMEILGLDQKQKEKLNKLRSLVHVESY